MSATLQELNQQETLVEGSVNLSLSLLRDFFKTIDPAMPVEVLKETLIDFLVALLTETRGQVSADAFSFYQEQRDKFPDLEPLTNFIEPEIPVNEEQVTGSVKWAVDPIYKAEDDAFTKTLENLEDTVDRLVRDAEQETILAILEEDPEPVGWYRIPEPNACTFCIMLGSRSVSYTGFEEAGGETKYHSNCRCRVAPFFPGDSFPDGYDPKALKKQWEEETGRSKAA